jgi:hypothetical protein
VPLDRGLFKGGHGEGVVIDLGAIRAMRAPPGVGAAVGEGQCRITPELGNQVQVALPGHRQSVVVAAVPVEHQGGQGEKPGDPLEQGVEQVCDAQSCWRQGPIGFGGVLAALGPPWTTLGGRGGLCLLGRFGLAGRFFCLAAHDLLDADGERTPLLEAHQGQREDGQPWPRLALEARKEAIQAMGVLARFGGHDFITHQQVDVISTVGLRTKAHPKQRGPRQCLGEKALHRPITTAWARPAGDAQPRHASRHDQQSRYNTAPLA